MKKRLLALLLVVLIMGSFLTTGASAANYDASAAVAYAAANWNSNENPYCDQFVKACLKAGGITITVGGVGAVKKAVEAYGTSYELTKNGSSILASENEGKIAAGDPIFYYCSSCGEFVHVAICGGINSEGKATAYGHNKKWNNVSNIAGYYHGTHSGNVISLYTVHINTSDTPVTPTAPDAPSASVVTINYAAETITYDGKYEVSATNFGSVIPSGGSISSYVGSISGSIYVRVKQDGSTPASDATEIKLKNRPATPMPMDFIDYANESFKTTAAYQYSLNDSSWSNCAGATPISVAPEGSTVYFRLAATGSDFASGSFTQTVPTRSAAPSADVVTIDFINETISLEDVYEANTAADFSGSAIESGGSVQPGASVYVRTKATDDAIASASAQVSIPARPEAPTVEAVDETIDGKGDGQITGVTAAMEYRAAGGGWADCPEGSVTGLADGGYEVRSKATEESFASEAASVTIGQGVPATYTLELTIPELADEVYNYAQPEGSALNITSSGNSRAEIISVAVDDAAAFEIAGSGQYVEAGGSLTSYIVRPKTGLEAGDYTATVTVNYKGGETYSGEETFTVTADIAFTVECAPQATPAAPSLESRTMNSITLKALPAKENGAQPQYRMNGGAWQTSTKFEGLRPGTTYVFEQRYAAVGSYLASEPSAKAQISTVSPMLSEPHDIVVVPSLNGSVNSSLQNSSEGGTIWLTVTPDEGYRLATLRVIAENGTNVAVYRQSEAEYFFTMPDASVEVYAEFTDGSTWIPFLDVGTRDWYYDAVVYVYSKGMMQGVTDTAFGPGSTMTRAMLWTVLARIDGIAVDGGSPWYAKAQSWAMGYGISDGTLPNDIVTREQFVTMLWRYAGTPAAYGSLAGFPDAGSVSSWAYDAMCWAVACGIVEGGDGGALSSNAGITRAQAAAIFMRYAEL